MSTASKVLVVLVLLIAPVWIVMVSAVAELNKNSAHQVDDLKKQVSTLEADLARMKGDVMRLKDQISLGQETMNQALTVAYSHKSDLQKARSQSLESAARAGFQLADMREAAKRAEGTRDLRVAEKEQETTALATAEAEVEQLKQNHAQLTEQLEKLQSDFKATIDANRKLLDRLKAKKRS
jgi:cell division protein FtsB